jgi:hypothetical protein
MKDNQFSILIKNFIGNFGGPKTVYWGMRNHEIIENGFSFILNTGNFCGMVMITVTEPSKKDEFCLSYLTSKEIDDNPLEVTDEILDRRMIVIAGSKIADYIDNIQKGQRVPQHAIKPRNGSNVL